MNSLNKLQKKVVIIGFVAIILCCAFPPWIHTYKAEGVYSEESAGYSLLMHPPSRKKSFRFGVKLDTSRLLLQIFMVSLTTGFGIFISKDKKSGNEV